MECNGSFHYLVYSITFPVPFHPTKQTLFYQNLYFRIIRTMHLGYIELLQNKNLTIIVNGCCLVLQDHLAAARDPRRVN